eukprot:TRINITY_DN2315_c0_g1_i3.p1 TRINITY_DN2315_c0_g1~~TRINITY_DN2315_c0_g1_i3.p1  ORF type:complete len:168 (-),score=29.56 TRINITY_DN2315_c0_g1_i3:398-856(-)
MGSYDRFVEELIEDCMQLGAEDDAWKFMKEDKGVKIYQRRYKDSKFDVVKGITMLPFPVSEIEPHTLTPESRKPWSHTVDREVVLEMLHETEELRLSIEQITTNKIFVISPRDFVVLRVARRLPDGSCINATRSIGEYKSAPGVASGIVSIC